MGLDPPPGVEANKCAPIFTGRGWHMGPEGRPKMLCNGGSRQCRNELATKTANVCCNRPLFDRPANFIVSIGLGPSMGWVWLGWIQ